MCGRIGEYTCDYVFSALPLDMRVVYCKKIIRMLLKEST
ncbi:hypothetical protein APHWI1_0246 [Anaplasma phagocytophilum str. ApWI1]|uniref:Uncharacterized protein n=1 Tax=Anaplasma phagocytophilum str. ApWI1 TaxID=1359155 RepID=A0A0F3PY65_ANAPH|nr:hypothetical protein APHHGE2_1045 [Anaplasma phagocytophilum str. HGE2]KJV85208.1 hypothetical protein APHWI1_0246 [Anaplasma phagocytophilum str. ApWI1]KJV86722.1 hypothetical protein APHNYW_0758 [Anaplasma phagocytophilum str. ApNYW]KJV98654.1 hypothetical protein OTSANNIE_1018 [Anaplasma phagocytophilum str. Annie]